MGAHAHDFVVVANRLPVDVSTAADGTTTVTPSPGGLVTALKPVLEKQRGCWVGWPGTIGEIPEDFASPGDIHLHPVALNQQEFEEFYEGFSNATLWPLYHDLIVTPVYNSDWWESYREVNHAFARAAAEVAAEGAVVWVQDYQLQLVPSILKLLRPDVTVGFFLHIPFPSPELFRQLPWREEILRGICGADLIGCHVPTSATNLLQSARTSESVDSVELIDHTSVREPLGHIITTTGRRIDVGAFPISIDSHSLKQAAAEAPTLPDLPGAPQIVLGVDRLDYTKGILQRLNVFEELYAAGAIENTVFVQIATPSRERIDNYRATRAQVEQAVGRINGLYGQVGAPVVHYLHRNLSRQELLSFYNAADVMLVTPYKDGMNLVAKEYVACHGDGSGALVLSEFAGAAEELTRAYLCNPYDVESIKAQLVAALKAVADGAARGRMLDMHSQVIACDVALWAESFLACLKNAATRT
ncbi:alpha,alpha-trehalose-phosphate synthase (UDP-forming) [Corynebacterium aquilae]|uniref:alpha,alpha-trehalose-phosphate synthase (ADP-forming) n=1 Tax=Corynebacterium aquilae DSM 44791 TaxID=1431546 RepID=A0A1L7CHY5_9CORY|nr:trehalose-6-phosphate synthase [Corynebacterium aquilae]APT85467.1 trehalose-phosphate synthase [Corynebacterium aquilae DSM 44791]